MQCKALHGEHCVNELLFKFKGGIVHWNFENKRNPMNAIYSKINLQTSSEDSNFYSMIADLVNHEKVKQLDGYSQHMDTSRYQHSINVAYYSFLLAKKFKLNVYETVRAAMLHDFFLYNWRTEQPVKGSHVNVHPQQALLNAQSITEVTPIMEDVIVSHMWPIGNVKPKSKEAWVVSAADKLATILELTFQLNVKTKKINLTPVIISLMLLIV